MPKRRQAIYAVIPLLLLLLCLGLVNLLPGYLVEPTAVSATPTPIAQNDQSGALPTVAPTTALPPSPTPTTTPTPTPTPLPTVPPETEIVLLGPPDGSVLPAAAPISLFWTWPLDLGEGQRFVIYLLVEDEERPLPPLSEPNMGSVYQQQLQPADLAGLAGDIRWEVRLEGDSNDTPWRVSQTRVLRLLAPP
jgi:hypothetical protein